MTSVSDIGKLLAIMISHYANLLCNYHLVCNFSIKNI